MEFSILYRYMTRITIPSHYTRWLLVAILPLVLGLVSCHNEGDPASRSRAYEGPTYITIDLGLRSHQDDTYSVNEDATDREDEIREVRILLFQQGALRANLYYSKIDETHNTLAYTDAPSGATATFRVDNPGIYDMVVIANESLSLNNDLTAALRNIATREQLNTLPRIKFVDPASEEGMDDPVIPAELPRLLCPLTAEYHAVNMTVGATQDRPHRIHFPTATGKVELMRALAKVELTIKDVVYKRGAEYEWIAPETFGPILVIAASSMAKTYPLMPLNAFTPVPEISFSNATFEFDPITSFVFPETPEEKFVVKENQSEDWSIGGIKPLDYKLFFYIPETLLPEGKGLIQQPHLLFYYTHNSGNWWDPTTTRIITFRPISNPNTKAVDYLREAARLSSSPMLEYGAYSVYRNSCYRITVSFDSKYDNPD